MYKELQKFSTGKKVEGVGVLPDKKEVKIYYNEYEASLGELIEDFIDHKTKPFWKRKYYHNHLTKLYKDFLGNVTIKHAI